MPDREEHPLGFEVIDKRGANNPIKEKETPVNLHDSRDPSNRKWTSVAYLIVFNHAANGEPVIMGRAAGLADDECLFTADYIFGMRWEQGFDWTVDAKRRLDTFLTCTCHTRTGPCDYHHRMAPRGWQKEDIDRIRDEGNRVIPKVVELLMKAELTRQQAQRIMAPPRR